MDDELFRQLKKALSKCVDLDEEVSLHTRVLSKLVKKHDAMDDAIDKTFSNISEILEELDKRMSMMEESLTKVIGIVVINDADLPQPIKTSVINHINEGCSADEVIAHLAERVEETFGSPMDKDLN